MPSSFTEYPLSEEILSALEQLQYRTPTPVQVKVIPEILKGKDVLAKSKGSSNAHNLVKATILALSEMRDARTVAQMRGISIEKVFRG